MYKTSYHRLVIYEKNVYIAIIMMYDFFFHPVPLFRSKAFFYTYVLVVKHRGHPMMQTYCWLIIHVSAIQLVRSSFPSLLY